MKKLLKTIIIAAVFLILTTSAWAQENPLLVMMHFDDGYHGVYENAFPLMEQYGYRGTVFMPTRLIDHLGHMNLTQLQALKKAGWEIGSHTQTHPNLRTLKSEAIIDEILGSRNDLEASRLLTLDTAYFCSPMTVWNSEISQLVNEHYVAARAKKLIIFDTPKQPHQHLRVILKDTKLKSIRHWISEAKSDNALLILIFHEIADGGNEYFFSPEKFDQSLQILKNTNAKIITIEEFLMEWQS